MIVCGVVSRQRDMASIAWFLSILYLHAVYAQYAGEPCKLSDGTQSICSNVASCPEAIQAINTGDYPPICSYDKDGPILCCPRKPASKPDPVGPGVKSREKCREYGKLVFVEGGGSPLIGGDDEPEIELTKLCGAKDDADGLIIGGEEADPNEFPHMAAIGYGEEDDIGWLCGGSLISERFVLTAAHCMVADERGVAKWVMLGDTDLKKERNVGSPQMFSIEERFRHQDYKFPSSYNDIALFKMNRNARFNQYVRPACLHIERGIGQAKGLASGYGKTNWMDTEPAKVLMRVWLDIVSGDRCNASYRRLYGGSKIKTGIDDNRMVCAGDPKGEKDTCGGDSGGPLQILLKDPECMYSIVGITSWGNVICGSRNTPAIYTRVSNYVSWIESKVWPAVNQPLRFNKPGLTFH